MRKGRNNRRKERDEKIEKEEVLYRREGKGQADRDLKKETEKGRRGYMRS